VTTLVTALVLASALIHASWNALVKGKTGDPIAASTGLCLTWAILGAPATLLVPAPPTGALPYLAASVVVHVIYFALLNAAYREADLSFVYTVARGVPPILVAVGALLFVGERPSPAGLAGVVLIALGVLLLGWPSKATTGRSARALGLALATAACTATYTVIDGLGARQTGDAASYLVWLTAVQGAAFAGIALALRGRPLAREVRARWKVGLATGVLSALGYGIALFAMTRAPIALVAAVRETAVLFAALIGAVLLREPFGRRRMVAALIVAAGAVAVRAG
jgi:drug/metabolite transporter (DMT)-like permease